MRLSLSLPCDQVSVSSHSPLPVTHSTVHLSHNSHHEAAITSTRQRRKVILSPMREEWNPLPLCSTARPVHSVSVRPREVSSTLPLASTAAHADSVTGIWSS